MDKRCPRRLDKSPTVWCPLAVTKLRELRASGGSTNCNEEHLPGCNWFIFNQVSGYCFWKYIQAHNTQPISEAEIAYLLCTTEEDVKETLATAMEKIKNSPLGEEWEDWDE